MRTNIRRDALLLFILIIWVLFVLGGYYYFHKPITISMLSAPLQGLLDLSFIVLFAGLAGGLGRRALTAETISPLERAAVQFAIGCGILSLAWFLLGVLGLYRYPLGAPLLVLGWFLLRKDALAWYAELGEIKTAWRQSAVLEKLLALCTLVLVIYQLFIALAPPVKWDALAYHLQMPRQYLAAGRLVFLPENPYWGHPQLVEMLYTFAMSFHRAETAAALGWSAGVIFLLGLLGCTNASLARLRGGEPGTTAGWMAVTAVAAGLTFRSLMGWSYSDLFSALFGLACLVAFFAWLDQRRAGWFLWAALFCGFALGTKWTSGVLALAIFTCGLIFHRQAKLSIRRWLLGGCIVAITIAPWLLKNLVVTGSPIYPYFFGTPWFDAARIASANPTPTAIDWWQHILLPFSTTWSGVDSSPGFATDLGPLLLLFALPGYILAWRWLHTRVMAILLAFTALGMGVASLRNDHLLQTRLYFAALPALAIPCGWGWDWMQRQVLTGVRLRRIFAAVVLLVMGLSLWQDTVSMERANPASVFWGTQTRQAYLENTIGFSILAMQKLEALPASSRILMLWEPRGFYAPLNTQADLWIDRWRTDRRELGSARAILQRWKEQGFTHLLIYQPGMDLVRPPEGQSPSPDWTVLQETLSALPTPVSTGDIYLLYKLPW